MDIDVRNGIVLENILQIADVACAAKLSAVCKRWYEQINNDMVLWSRLLQLEQIEDPDYWFRDEEDDWILGTPCKPKNIIVNYRRSYYCIKHNKYKKYDLVYNDSSIFDYDGKTLLFTLDNELHVYKIINNNLELFQKIDLGNEGFDYISHLDHDVYTNSEFIVINDNIYGHYIMVTYRLVDNKYVPFNERSFQEFGRLEKLLSVKLLRSNVLIGTCCNNTVIAWNIPEDRILFSSPNYEFVEYINGIIYTYNKEEKKFVLFNEEFQIILSINQNFDDNIPDVIECNNQVILLYKVENNTLGISTLDKSTGQIKARPETLLANKCTTVYKVFSVNNNIIIAYLYGKKPRLVGFNSKFQRLWINRLPSVNQFPSMYTIFNKFLIVNERKDSKQCSIEFRDVDNGKVVFTTESFNQNFLGFNKDMLVLGQKATTILLYR